MAKSVCISVLGSPWQKQNQRLNYRVLCRLYSLAGLKPEAQNQGVIGAILPLKALRKGFLPPPAPGVSMHSLACGHIVLISDSASTFPSPHFRCCSHLPFCPTASSLPARSVLHLVLTCWTLTCWTTRAPPLLFLTVRVSQGLGASWLIQMISPLGFYLMTPAETLI